MLLAGVAERVAERAVAHAALPHLPRCYWVGPPLAQFQRVLLQRGNLECAQHQCQFTLHQTTDAGWVCFFARPWGENE